MSRLIVPLAAALLAACGSSSSSSSASAVTSQAYGHHNEKNADTNNLVNVYPATVGTRLDSCQTCHKSFVFTSTDPASGKTSTTPKTVCDYCHLVQEPDRTTYNEAQPTSYGQTLNPFGIAYRDGGRNPQALRDIDGQDADEDGHANGVEIAALRYPGDAKSNPDLPFGPSKTISVDDIRKLPLHSEFLLSNSKKQQYDEYAIYDGVKITDLLQAVGVDPADPNIAGVTVIAPDGFTRDFSRQAAAGSTQYWFDAAFPSGVFYPDLDTAHLGTTCGFVYYPTTIPADRIGADGRTITDEQWLTLAYQKNGAAIPTAYINPANLTLQEEGPLRLIVPQKAPAKPDRGLDYSPTSCADGYDYDKNLDHNAGFAVRGVVAIKILAQSGVTTPAQEDFDYQNRGYEYLANGQVVVFGYGISQ